MSGVGPTIILVDQTMLIAWDLRGYKKGVIISSCSNTHHVTSLLRCNLGGIKIEPKRGRNTGDSIEGGDRGKI